MTDPTAAVPIPTTTAGILAALDTLDGHGGPETHDAYQQIRRASTATCERCGENIPGSQPSGWWICLPCEDKGNGRHNRIRIRRP